MAGIAPISEIPVQRDNAAVVLDGALQAAETRLHYEALPVYYTAKSMQN